MSTQMAFLEDTYNFEFESTVVDLGSNEQGSYIILDKTLFYPQGGGQPSDQGYLKNATQNVFVNKVRLVDQNIFHFVESNSVPFRVGEKLRGEINATLRLNHAASHTAGHLIACGIESINPGLKAIKAYHFLDGPYVEFVGGQDLGDVDLVERINAWLFKSIGQSLEIKSKTYGDESQETAHGLKTFRTVQIGDFESVPCGGTHLKNLNELKEVRVTKLKKTKEGFRTSYTFLGPE